MMNSKIEWTDHTFNPWIGCQKVSPGCDHCYAEVLMDRRYGLVEWGPRGERRKTRQENWKMPIRWNRQAQDAGGRSRVFCASLGDWLDNQVPTAWRDELAELIEATPHLDWLLLTKRIELFGKLAPWPRREVPKNVWIGVTCENQECFDRRWKHLCQIEAVRFVSYEPALGPLTLGTAELDWVICGGESGAGARPLLPKWARSLRAECVERGIAFFMKQVGSNNCEWPGVITRKGDDPREWPKEFRIRQFPSRRIDTEKLIQI